MDPKMQKALLLAKNIKEFMKLVEKHKNGLVANPQKIYQVKLFIGEYKFRIIADELYRINQFEWDEKYTHYLVESFQKGISTIDEYVQNHYEDLYILTARIYTLKNLSRSFDIEKNIIT